MKIFLFLLSLKGHLPVVVTRCSIEVTLNPWKFLRVAVKVTEEWLENPLPWWKQHGHLFLKLSWIATWQPPVRPVRRYLTTPGTSCPVERLFSVTGWVDATRRTSLSTDNLTLVVCIHQVLPVFPRLEVLPVFRKIRTDRILSVGDSGYVVKVVSIGI
jgi:hypothetical protein